MKMMQGNIVNGNGTEGIDFGIKGEPFNLDKLADT
jgi:hypothetical protein